MWDFLFINLTLRTHISNIFSMKKLLSLFAIISAVTAFSLSGAYAYVDRQNAVLNVLDKASGKTHIFSVPVGKNAEYEKLSFIVRTCKQTDPFQAENSFMFIEISQNNEKIFSGWMNKNEPGINPLQNADYDMWLVRCE